MPNLSHQAHLTAVRDGTGFTFGCGKSGRDPGSFRQECVHAASLIGDASPGPVNLLMSGGIDSELVAESLLAARVPFVAHAQVFPGDSNYYDVRYVYDWCFRRGVELKTHELDAREFMAGEVRRHAAIGKCASPLGACNLALAARVGGFVVMGYGDLDIKRIDGKWCSVFSERSVGAFNRYFEARALDGVSHFFLYTPELMLSFLRDPSVAAMLDDAIPAIDDVLHVKGGVYGLPFRFKYSGFEAHLRQIFPVWEELEKEYKDWNATVEVPVDSLIRRLSP